MNCPEISIIIATYNSASTIRVALDSVREQKYQNWECIVVDGKSKDNTILIVEEFESIDSRFHHISEKDNGIYDAFNKGWKLSKGEWIYFLGSDDKLTDTGFSDLMSVSLDGYGAVSGDVWIIKLDGSLKKNISNGYSGCHQGKLVRRFVIESMNGFNEQYAIMADRDLMYRMENSGVKILNIRSYIAYFSMNGTSQQLKGEIQRFRERIKIHKANNKPGIAEIESAMRLVKSLLSVNYRKIRSILKK